MNGMAPLCKCGCGNPVGHNPQTGAHNKYASRRCREDSAARTRNEKIKAAYGISHSTYYKRRREGTLPALVGPAYEPKA